MTTPDEIRTGLSLVTAAAVAEVAEVVRVQPDPEAQTSALFVAAPLIISSYIDGSSALALDWYEELREESVGLTVAYAPEPVSLVREGYISNVVAWATKDLREIETKVLADIEAETVKMLARIEAEIQKEVASGFRDTMTENAKADPDAIGWKRFARSGACDFCRFLSARGAIYSADTARFAAHTNCYCVARAVFGTGDLGPEADVLQYVASQRQRTPAEKKALRDYLKKKYGAE